jgi:TniQ
MTKARRLLIRHPSPKPTESLVGYLLRLTEANGYPNTHYMLADRGKYRFGEPISIHLLASITNWSARLLRPISFRSKDDKAGVILGQSISKAEMNTAMAPICPRCISEKGFMEAHFSLSVMTFCPEHRVIIKVCPGCSKPLTWKRPKLLQCNCGQALTHAEAQEVSTAAVELLAIVRTKALSLPTPTESVNGLPVRALEAMSLKSLLFLIRTLGRRSAGKMGKVDTSMDERKIVELAAQVLSDWPNNFRAMLDAKTGPASPSNPCKLSKGTLSGLYLAIMYGFKQRDEAKFVRDALVKYAADRFGMGTDDLNERARILGCGQQYVTRGEMAARLGVDRRFANRILAEGSIDTIRVEGARKRKRVLIDMSAITIPFSPIAKIYNTKEAADAIGIPRRVLVLLKETGMFETRYLPPGIRGFHQQDIEAFKARLLNPVAAGTRFSAQEKMRNLGRFLLDSSTGAMTKAMVIAEIYAGRMPVAAPVAKTVSEIQISQTDLRSLLQALNVPDWRVLRGTSWNLSNGHGGISMCQAAREIGCSQPAVRVLIQEGRLSQSQGNGCAMWVSAESVDTFRAQFESISSFAREIRSLPRVLMRVCDELHLPLLVINLDNGVRAAFIRKEDIPKVISGRQHVACADRQTRLRWEHISQMSTRIRAKEIAPAIEKSQTSVCTHEEYAA